MGERRYPNGTSIDANNVSVGVDWGVVVYYIQVSYGKVNSAR